MLDAVQDPYSARVAWTSRDRIHAQAVHLTSLVLDVDVHFPTPGQPLEELAYAKPAVPRP
jgi:hypothetical protein